MNFHSGSDTVAVLKDLVRYFSEEYRVESEIRAARLNLTGASNNSGV